MRIEECCAGSERGDLSVHGRDGGWAIAARRGHRQVDHRTAEQVAATVVPVSPPGGDGNRFTTLHERRSHDPVSLSTGLFTYRQTDFALPDVLRLSSLRVFRKDICRVPLGSVDTPV